MKTPLVVVLDDRSIALYNDTLTDIEPSDVHCCSAFDAEGNVLSLEIEEIDYERRFLGFISRSTYKGVVLKETLSDRKGVESLQRALIQYLNEYHGIPQVELMDLPISQLIEQVEEINKNSKKGKYR